MGGTRDRNGRDGGESDRAVIRSRAVRLLEYLEAVRGLREQPVRDVAEYQDRRWWAWELPAHPSCVLTATGDEPWLTVSKAQIPPAPPVPDDIAAYLRTGVTDPEVEPAFGPDFDDVFAGDPEEAGTAPAPAARLRGGSLGGLGAASADRVAGPEAV